MKIILSRKGFDSSAGGVASPIFTDGRMLSLPIPSSYSPVRYSDIEVDGLDIGKLVGELTGGKVGANDGVHFDPDITATARPRKRGWQPLFGQADAEQTVLERAGVGPGDVFLFFGWFRHVERRDGRFAYRRSAEDIHAIWGWLQVAAVYDLTRGTAPTWAEGHPHLDATPRRKNTLYAGASSLVIDGQDTRLPGTGVFARWRDDLRLTAPGRSRSIWSLPSWFLPGTRTPLGYHGAPGRWSRMAGRAVLKSVGRGQEFVLDVEEYPEAKLWLMELITGGTGARDENERRRSGQA